MLPTRFELYAVVFGTIKAGQIYLPLAPMFGPDALNYRLEDSEAAVLFTTADRCEAVDESRSTPSPTDSTTAARRSVSSATRARRPSDRSATISTRWRRW